MSAVERSHFAVVGLTLAVAGVVAAIAGGLFIWFGFFDVGASTKHSTAVEWLLHFAMQRSVGHYAPKLSVPNLADPTLVLRGALHYATGCAPCHGAPGQLASPIAQQMTPVPPGLYSADRDFDPSQLFWIVRNGVKMTAMPAWPAPERSDEVWAMVAFLEQLPQLKTPDYEALVGAPASAGWLPAPPASASSSLGFDEPGCARCHGQDGAGRRGVSPTLVGRSEPELEQALRDYRDGNRASGFMQPVAAQLSDAEIVSAARYYAGLTPAAAK